MAKTNDPGHIPGPVFIPQVAAVRLIWTLPNGKTANNVLHGHYTTMTVVDQTTINNLYTAIATAFTSSGYAGQSATTFKLQAVGVRDLAQAGPGVGHGEIMSNLAATPGSGTGDALPANVSFVVSLKTGFSLQANRGRVYLTGYTETVNDPGGVANSAVAVDAVTFMNAVKTGMGSSGLVLTIAHPARAGYTSPTTGVVHGARPAGDVLVTSIVALNNVWDSTRLRSLR